MSHNINYNAETGKHSFFSANTAAWHNLGQVVRGAQTWEEAMCLAGLDWEVEKLQFTHPTRTLPTGDPELLNAWGMFRKDNGAFLGQVGAQYTPIQNQYQFNFVDALLEADGEAHYETAGALGSGERVFCLAKIGGDFDVHNLGDRHETYLLFVTSHDGSSSCRALVTTVRVVCQNTLSMALSQGGRSALAVRHTKGAEAKLEQAKRLISAERVTAARVKEKLEILAERQLKKENRVELFGRMFPADRKTGKPTGYALSAITQILDLYERNDNDAIPEIRGTAYNFLNACTEYVDHHKATRETSVKQGWGEEKIRAESALFNGGAEWKNNVLDLILANTKHCETREIRRPVVSVPGGPATQVVELEPTAAPEAPSLLDAILADPRSKADLN